MALDHDPQEALEGVSSTFVENLYQRYGDDPDAVGEDWRAVFSHLEDGAARAAAQGPSWARHDDWPPSPDDDWTAGLDPTRMTPEPKPRATETPAKAAAAAAGPSPAEVRAATLDSIRALMMIRVYRVRGHLIADLDPLRLEEPLHNPELDPESYGFGPQDRNRPIFIDNVLGLETATMDEIVAILRRTYCASVGVEFMHINEPEEKAWIQQKIEGREKEIQFTVEGKRAILKKLIEAAHFETFLAKKYIGTKRFGLDGAEAIIPALEGIIKTGGQHGLKEIVLGMPHRGRLNVLANVMLKPFQQIFHEFQGGTHHPEDVEGSGDVKYHLGTSADREFDGNVVHMSLTANPSHLEAVDPVVLGKARAKLTQRGDHSQEQVLSLLLHGDAAFSGQGLVAECFSFSGLRGYRTGGTVHFVVNNQIGFTTSPIYARSSPYPSDMAKIVQAPIFHVNGDDPEAVVYATKLATEFRQKFKRDVVVDMFCYRRFGHNEADEPSFTQPLMYAAIRNHPHVIDIYAKRLVDEGVVTRDEVDGWVRDFTNLLEDAFDASKDFRPNRADWLEGRWRGLKRPRLEERPAARRAETGVDADTLRRIGDTITTLPETFHPHKTLKRILGAKEKMFHSGTGFDWATAEALAFGSLLDEGYWVRLSGQDSGRGTFSQRHAVYVDQKTEARHIPLRHVNKKAHFEVLDSPLSEFGVMGFEYGFSLAEPNALVLWEAQFGDFANGAQVIIDQFISSAEVKWLRMSGIVLLLPHGYEGQGPEHSSARLERFLQLCAEDNMQVANCTTPANYFHILRRQLHRDFRKPLVLMTPKSLLRHKKCVSSLAEMGPGTQFHRVLYDDADMQRHSTLKLTQDDRMRRLVLCSGKVYFDLLEKRDEADLTDVYLARVEQLYPYPHEAVLELLERFANLDSVVWCQEEPQNMGAWRFIEPLLEETMTQAGSKAGRPRYAGRNAAAATATGLASTHKRQQDELVAQALDLTRS
ncbi:2-oxoglutarate dehydrogenase E1 component [Rhodothalassium salexigens DSM 2132]|uniref:2-oxoglutarate dehydrogenase E1 component n=1 Tax=Rhodothalassium salexigens DSM 2132 TaxID=1188247 RepID=A0A4R2PFY2_RHOSA|nr:2-oxoglutarate dehydrogenase E1 component [Rhodothalassium salexigens]MBB4211988.1 2-oxoglutarate dehydrogenase E1 component [Rhodothalassium salexigens DSM 2132]MBK1638526.1 2-oxoglutarate dehydrogenase E1 component [Rhodothalassium salexigens DSM 2132]TCP33428.1 2-oxoglutarate dehydrogenase E1 component [Rhodothalassium salexigens DSM 2132]